MIEKEFNRAAGDPVAFDIEMSQVLAFDDGLDNGLCYLWVRPFYCQVLKRVLVLLKDGDDVAQVLAPDVRRGESSESCQSGAWFLESVILGANKFLNVGGIL